MKSWFLSDLHLKDVNERNGNTLLRFLFYLNQNPKQHRLFLLGDIFDFWLSDGRAFVRHYQQLVDEIAKFKKNGGDVYYFEGNHDFHIDVFWTKRLGIPVIEEMQYFDIGGYRVRLEHGDFINPDDTAYLQYRARIRHPWIEPIGHIVPGFFWKWFGEKKSQQSRKQTARYTLENTDGLRQMIRSYAQKVYTEEPFDIIVTGHMHVYDDYEFESEGKKIRSINLGTWLEKPRVLMIEGRHVETIDLTDFL
ncbi:UDP-2,3-diacylglucosamine diphosphatase [Pseudobdellovibrio exovorus]|uniref:UDP-2,3-diacylglucosamine hydrolase n=1 Tax=Pseudobdellovibrio exovorus JSS TaxID=1184267 RepID=M4V9Z2_9BACT|nr:UDP-2,3-diacylglucosamine diphosphatase [Pseudobdellovibrio exovorus]AGH96222.1 UDP-2,3-diacylglucosamine hydrolase [Pseudobdellovibrio exovorus JSS]